jgi:superfamily II DNA or RNA helicase
MPSTPCSRIGKTVAHEEEATEEVTVKARLSTLESEVSRLRAENARLRDLLGLDKRADRRELEPWRPTLFAVPDAKAHRVPSVDQNSSEAEKIALFSCLFSGRTDVHAVRWENARDGRSGWSPAVEGGSRNAKRPDRRYVPLTDTVIDRHLSGEIHVGLYPLQRGDTCRLLACDFDGSGWALDALAFVDATREFGIPVALERSRSGDGAHVWIFFDGDVPAASARKIGVNALRRAMAARAEIDLLSYDRLFPAQDFLPKGSFGNLIALPLQGSCRKVGTTVFLDPTTLEPYGDQWAFLSGIERLGARAAVELAAALGELGAGPDTGAMLRPALGGPAPPEEVQAVAGAMVAIERIGVPPAILAGLKHLASLHNPEFYERERMRFSTWNTPRFVRCYHETLDRLMIPRGLREKASRIVADAGSRLVVTDRFSKDAEVNVRIVATLTPEQAQAVEALTRHDLGILVAPPGSGKTVVGCALIAHHRVPALILVDRKPLADQWRDRLVQHLGLGRKQIGQLGGGKRRTTGVVDIAMVQSLARQADLAELTSRYGLVIVDECHHVPAVMFERVVRQIAARRWAGLTATPYRRDGLQALMTMHTGPVRHTMATSGAPALRAMDLVVHETDHAVDDPGQHIQTTFRGLVEDRLRTAAICADIEMAAKAGRTCLVLTRWKEHLESITATLIPTGLEVLALHGQTGRKSTAAVIERLASSDARGSILVATAGLLGEGFDCPNLDTLFLAFPIKFKGSVVQYVGRILRPTDEKTRIEVHDYVDVLVPVLARMHDERRNAYVTLGFDIPRRRRPVGRSRS